MRTVEHPDRRETSGVELPSVSGTFLFTELFTDIESSSGPWEQDPAAMRMALDRHDEMTR